MCVEKYFLFFLHGFRILKEHYFYKNQTLEEHAPLFVLKLFKKIIVIDVTSLLLWNFYFSNVRDTIFFIIIDIICYN